MCSPPSRWAGRRCASRQSPTASARPGTTPLSPWTAITRRATGWGRRWMSASPRWRSARATRLASVRSFRRALRRIRPDLLVTYNWGATEWALANALPLVRHVHIEDGFGPEEQAGQIARRVWLRRLFLRRATVMVPSRTLWRIATEIWRLPPRACPLHPERHRPGPLPDRAGRCDAVLAGGRSGDRHRRHAAAGEEPAAPAARDAAADRTAARAAGDRRRGAGAAVAAGSGGGTRPCRPRALHRLLPDAAGHVPRLRRLCVVVGYRADAAVGAGGDGRRPAGGGDRCRRCATTCWREANLPFVVPRDDAALADAMERLLRQPDCASNSARRTARRRNASTTRKRCSGRTLHCSTESADSRAD